jgi:hypothetical protein
MPSLWPRRNAGDWRNMKKQAIERIEIVITPFYFNSYQRELMVRIITYPGGEYEFTQILPLETEDHFQSMFDHIWDNAKRIIEEKLKSE